MNSYGQLNTLVGTDRSRFLATSLGSLQKTLAKSRFTIRNRTRAPFDRSSGTAISKRHMRCERGGTEARSEIPAVALIPLVTPNGTSPSQTFAKSMNGAMPKIGRAHV